MNRRRKSSLLWGVVGAMTFIVLAQGSLILSGPLPVGIGGIAAIGLLVGMVVTTVSYVVEPWVVTKGR